jgi:hypothetical protein
MWRDFNARLNRLFGSRGNGGGGAGGPTVGEGRGAGITASVIGFIVLLIWLASGAFIVQEGQVGVVTTFGRLSTPPAPASTGAGRPRSRPTKPSTSRRCAPPKSATATTCATSRAPSR